MIQADDPPLILASQSPFRAGLLTGAGLRFEAAPAYVDEAEIKHAVRAEGGTAEDAAVLLAQTKAQRITRRRPEALVIGADQILVCEGQWFDKPPDMSTARHHLETLRGREHVLATAMVVMRGGQRIWHHIARPKLRMRVFSDAFLASYLALEGDVLTTTVGAYRLEGPGVHLFNSIEGEHSAILGLPLLPLLDFLRQHGVISG